MIKTYEALTDEWRMFCEDPNMYSEKMCTRAIERDPNQSSVLTTILKTNANYAKVFCDYPVIVQYELEPKQEFAIPNFADIFVGLMSGESDQVTSYNVTIGDDCSWGQTTLHPGKPTLALRGTHVLPTLPLQFSEPRVLFTGPVPRTLKFIGGSVGIDYDNRHLFQEAKHKFCFENGETAYIHEGIAFEPTNDETIVPAM